MRGLRTSLIAASLLCLPAAVQAQVETPAPVSNAMPTNDFGFNLPSKVGTLSYSLSGSEQVGTGYYGSGAYAGTALNGNLAYISKSENNPFSLVYSGGVFLSNATNAPTAQTYQNIAASQVFRTRSWVFVASDSFSYLPSAPTTGLSGVAGVGDVGVFPVQTGIGPDQSILTNSSSRISNGLSGSATWQMTPSWDLQGSATWQVLSFTGDNPGYNSDSVGATFGPNYRIDARNSIGASAYYSRNTYPGNEGYLIETEGVQANYSRAWTRRISTTFSAGPARTHGTSVAPIPSQWNATGSASVNYATRTTGLYASYARAVNGGSGVIFGALTDTVSVGMNRPLSRDWILGADVGYAHNVSLAIVDGAFPTYDSVFGAAQVSRRLTNTLSMYASYTGISQSVTNQPVNQTNAFNGFNSIFSIGITFAPAPLISGR